MLPQRGWLVIRDPRVRDARTCDQNLRSDELGVRRTSREVTEEYGLQIMTSCRDMQTMNFPNQGVTYYGFFSGRWLSLDALQ